MKRKFGIITLLLLLVACLTFGLAGCRINVDGPTGKNPRIVIETEETEFALEIYSDYKMPFAGVFDENLDRVDGKEIRMSVIDPTGGYYIENSLDYELIRFVETGKFRIIYSAEGCADAEIVIYVCERLDMASNFVVNGKTLTWDPIVGAVGYEVTVNGAETTYTTEPTFTSDIFSQSGFYVGVTAKADNKTFIDSYMRTYQNRIPLKEGELAAFDNPCYELDIVQATPSTLNAAPYDVKYVSEEECAGSTGGAVKFTMRAGDYGTGLFRVNLKNVISKDATYDGIEIRFKLDSKDYVYSESSVATTLLLAQPSKDEQRLSRGITVYREYNDCWQILKLPKSIVDNFDGCDFLQFSLYMLTKSGGVGTLYLDYIHTYTEKLATPTGLAVSGDKLDWADVDGAKEYMISVDKIADKSRELERNYYYATASEIALTAIGIDPALTTQEYEIKVCAVPAAETKGSSAWSETIVKRAALAQDDLLPLDNALYTLNAVDPVVNNNNGKTVFNHIRYKEYATVTGAEGGNALRTVLLSDGTKSFVTLNLPAPLNLENGYHGIIMRFKVENSDYDSAESVGIQLIGSESDTQNYTGLKYRSPVKMGTWQEYQLSMDDLREYYKTGDTKLSFAINNTVANAEKSTVTVTVAWDYIRYFKSLSAPTGLAIDGTTLTWNEVTGASGYTVYIEGDETYTEDATLDISHVNKDAIIKVRTETTQEGFTHSLYSEAVHVHGAFAENELANMNHEGYIYDVVEGNPNVACATGNSQTFKGATRFDIVGKSVYVEPRVTTYSSGAGNIYVYSVNLHKGLDLTKDGLSIDVKYDYVSAFNKDGEGEKVYFTILSNTEKSAGYTQDPTTIAGAAFVELDTASKIWQSLTVSSAQLTELQYETGDAQLTFAIWRTTAKTTYLASGIGAGLYLGAINHCGILDTPANARVEEKLFKWDEVEGANGYTVRLNDQTFVVTKNEFDLSEISVDATLSVCANSTTAGVENSFYTASISYICPKLDTPTNVRAEDGFLKWNAVENASGYTVLVNEEPFAVATNEFDLSILTDNASLAVYANSTTKGVGNSLISESISYVCPRLDTPTNVRVEDGFLKWNEVEGASGYTVLVNGNATVVETNEFNLSTVDTDANLSVYANSATKGVLDSLISESVPYYILLEENELANFNNAVYTNNVGYVEGGKWQQWQIAPTYNDDGTVTFGVYKDYYGTDGDWNVLSAFTVSLPKALDLTKENYDGIQVKVHIDNVSKVNSTAQPATFAMLDVRKKSTWRTDAPAEPSYTLAANTSANGATGWIELSITKAQLTALGYKTGDTVLTFGVWVADRAIAATGGGAKLTIDYINYYKGLETPANVRIEGNFLKWDEVEGASGYTVLADGETFIAETNSLALSKITKTASLSVCANSATAGIVNSLYSAAVPYYVLAENELAAFDSAVYTQNIGFIQGNHWKAFAEEPTYEKAGTPEGTVTFGVRKDDYRATTANWTDVSAFTVTLPKALDMANGYDGIEIKLYVNWVSKAGTVATPTVTLEMLNPTDKTTYHTASTPSVTIGDGTTAASGEMTLKITTAQLTALGYKTGDTVLTFGIRVNDSTQASGGGSSNLAIDYVQYYKAASEA